jgi:DNA polymerase IIIc chi subunit
MKQASEAKIAWLLYHLLDELNDQLWNRYEKEFIRLATEEEEEERRAGERLSEIDPDSSSQPQF